MQCLPSAARVDWHATWNALPRRPAYALLSRCNSPERRPIVPAQGRTQVVDRAVLAGGEHQVHRHDAGHVAQQLAVLVRIARLPARAPQAAFPTRSEQGLAGLAGLSTS